MKNIETGTLIHCRTDLSIDINKALDRHLQVLRKGTPKSSLEPVICLTKIEKILPEIEPALRTLSKPFLGNKELPEVEQMILNSSMDIAIDDESENEKEQKIVNDFQPWIMGGIIKSQETRKFKIAVVDTVSREYAEDILQLEKKVQKYEEKIIKAKEEIMDKRRQLATVSSRYRFRVKQGQGRRDFEKYLVNH